MKIVRVYFRDEKLREAWIFFFFREQFVIKINEKHRTIRFENPSIPAWERTNYVKSNLHKIENLTLIDNGVRGCIERVRANRYIRIWIIINNPNG